MSECRPSRLCLLLFLALLSAPLSVFANEQTHPLADQVRALQLHLQALQSFSFDFDQRSMAEGRERQGRGNAVFFRRQPQDVEGSSVIMRWNYTEPDRQIILNDGQNLTIYTEADHQAIISSSDALESDITYTLFSGDSDILDTFTVSPIQNQVVDAGLLAALLTPKEPHAQIQSVELLFDTSQVIHRLILHDHFDTVTDITFLNVRSNPLADAAPQALADLLNLDLPPDTEILRQ